MIYFNSHSLSTHFFVECFLVDTGHGELNHIIPSRGLNLSIEKEIDMIAQRV